MKLLRRETCLTRLRIGIGPLGPACRLLLIPLSPFLRILLPLRLALPSIPTLVLIKRASMLFFKNSNILLTHIPMGVKLLRVKTFLRIAR